MQCLCYLQRPLKNVFCILCTLNLFVSQRADEWATLCEGLCVCECVCVWGFVCVCECVCVCVCLGVEEEEVWRPERKTSCDFPFCLSQLVCVTPSWKLGVISRSSWVRNSICSHLQWNRMRGRPANSSPSQYSKCHWEQLQIPHPHKEQRSWLLGLP